MDALLAARKNATTHTVYRGWVDCMCVDSTAEGVQRERLAHDLGKGVVGYTAFPQIGEKASLVMDAFYSYLLAAIFIVAKL